MSKKRRTKKSQRPRAMTLLVLVLLATNIATLAYFTVLNPSVPLEDVPMAIADIMGDSSYIGQVVSVLGYYIYTAGYHMLVSNPAAFFNNSLNPMNHVVIMGEVPEELESHIGFQISVKGVFELFSVDDETGVVWYDSFFDVETEITYPGIYREVLLDPAPMAAEYPDVFVPLDVSEDKYAVLYSGGINEQKAYYRYWNDIIYMRFILEMHGYKAENIYTVYKDGVSEDDINPVDYPATHDSMDTVFDILAAEMGSRDTLFFYTTNHGGSGGISVWNPMDTGGALTHLEVSDWLDSITCNNMIIVMEQCVSGKFIEYLSAPDRVIMTACADDESSWPCDDEGVWDEFVYHFMCALVSFAFHDPGFVVNADYFAPFGQISMKEAFIYASFRDSRDETPWYNDNGDGIGYNGWMAASSLAGSYGESVYL